jgi:hypothetical protein
MVSSIEDGGRLLFTADHVFNSPSLAAAVVYGGSVNGRSAWADTNGRTINDLDKISLDEQEAFETAPVPASATQPVPEGNG